MAAQLQMHQPVRDNPPPNFAAARARLDELQAQAANAQREFQPMQYVANRGLAEQLHEPRVLPPHGPAPLPPAQNNPGPQAPGEPEEDNPEIPDFVQAPNPQALPKYYKPLIETDVQRINLGSMNLVCPSCGALHWNAERLSKSTLNEPHFGTCCLNEKVVLPAIRAPPRDLLELFNGTSPHSEHFRKNI